MNKENGIKRLNRLSVKAKEYRDENTQVVKLSQAIEAIELIDQVGEPKLLSEEWLERHSEWATIQATGDYTIVVKNAWLRDMAVGETENDNKEFEALNKEYQKVSHQIDDLAVFLYQNMGIEPSGYENAVSVAIELLKKCKPEKPVVPQFVADWIEKEKRANSQLHSVISTSLNYSNHVENWIDWCKNNKKFTETIARAWLNGFLIEDDIEVWQPITGFYNEVSNLGRVRSVKHKAGNEKNYKSKILKPVVTNSGYVNVAIINKSEGKITKRLHRVVAEAFIPNPENKPEINHIDGNKENNEVSNLEWVTSKENKRHAWENDLQVSVKGSEKPLAKLKEEDIVSIRKEYREGCIQMELAEKYGVARQTISSIVNMKAWKHVAEEVSK